MGTGGTDERLTYHADKEIDRMLNYMTASRASAECEDCTSVDYTFIYLASPHEPPRQYESDYVESTLPETELRRRQWADQVMGRAEGNSTLPLFVKYQFFTPGKYLRPRFKSVPGSVDPDRMLI